MGICIQVQFCESGWFKGYRSRISFYGPMGYDIGNVIGNLVFPLVVRKMQ